MVLYTCEICNYTTKRKCDMIKHHQRKKPCSNLGNNETVIHKSKESPSFSSSFPSFFPSFSEESNLNKSGNICSYCGKKFTRKDNLKRHMMSNCKQNNKGINLNNITFTNEQLSNNNKDLVSKNIKLEVTNQLLEQKIDKLSNEILNRPAQIIKNESNTNIIKNQTNTQNIININSFGNENLMYITDNYLKSLISIPYNAIPKLVKDIHCNPEHPENQNIKKTNKKDKYIEIFNDGKWTYKDKNKVLDDIVDTTLSLLENSLDMSIDSKHIDRFEVFKQNYYDKNKDVKNTSINETELVILNNSKQ